MIERVFEIEGPAREFDVYILPGDTEADRDAAYEFVAGWVEELFNNEDVDATISFKERAATEMDRDIIEGEEA